MRRRPISVEILLTRGWVVLHGVLDDYLTQK
jgi:hypothetical protein